MTRFAQERIRTLGPEGDADGVGEDVDAVQDAGPALVGELNLLVGAALEHRLRGLRSGAANGGGRRGGKAVHGESDDEGRTRRRK